MPNKLVLFDVYLTNTLHSILNMPCKRPTITRKLEPQLSRHLAANEDSDTPTENDTSKPTDTPVTADKNLKPREEENSWDGGIYILDSEDDFVALGLA